MSGSKAPSTRPPLPTSSSMRNSLAPPIHTAPNPPSSRNSVSVIKTSKVSATNAGEPKETSPISIGSNASNPTLSNANQTGSQRTTSNNSAPSQSTNRSNSSTALHTSNSVGNESKLWFQDAVPIVWDRLIKCLFDNILSAPTLPRKPMWDILRSVTLEELG